MAPAFRLNPSLATSVVKSGWSHIIAGSRDNLQETSGKYMPCHPNINIYNPATYPTFCWCKCIVISFNNIKKCRTLTHPPFLGKPVNLIFVNGKPWAGLSWLNAKQQVIEPIFTWALGPLGTRNNGVTVKIIAISWHQQSPTHEIVIIYIIIYWFIQKIFWFGIIMNYHELSWCIFHVTGLWILLTYPEWSHSDDRKQHIQMMPIGIRMPCWSMVIPGWIGVPTKTSLNTDFPKNWQLYATVPSFEFRDGQSHYHYGNTDHYNMLVT